MSGAAAGLQLKLTITPEENPELHRELAAIAIPKRRTGRLKELALSGLLLERGRAPIGLSQATGGGRVQPAALAEQAEPADSSLKDILGVVSWGEDAS